MAVCSAPFQRQPLGLCAAAATDVDAFTSEKTHQVGHTRLVLMIDCCGAMSLEPPESIPVQSKVQLVKPRCCI